MSKEKTSAAPYTTAATVSMAFVVLRRLLSALSHTQAAQNGTAGDIGILLVWFVFPLAAFGIARWYSLRCRFEPQQPEPPQQDDPAPPHAFATYAYYPERKGAKDKDKPSPAKDTAPRDRAMVLAATVCAVVGLYLPLAGILFGVAALLLVQPALHRKTWPHTQARRAVSLGWCVVAQFVLYILVATYLL